MAKPTELRWDGLEELKAALRELPDDLKGEASHLVEGRANAAAMDIRSGYAGHRHSGNLQSKVTVTHFENGRYSTGAIVKNTAKHAWLFENGTQARHTKAGWNRGRMPPGHVFVPRIIRHRRMLYREIIEMMVRNGLAVTGDAAA